MSKQADSSTNEPTTDLKTDSVILPIDSASSGPQEGQTNYAAIGGALAILLVAFGIIGVVVFVMRRRKLQLKKGNSRNKRKTAHMSYLDRSPRAPIEDSGSGQSSPSQRPTETGAMSHRSEYRPSYMAPSSEFQNFNFRDSNLAMASSPSLRFDPSTSPPPGRNPTRMSVITSRDPPNLPTREPIRETHPHNFRNSSLAMSPPSLHPSQFDPSTSPPLGRQPTRMSRIPPFQEPIPEAMDALGPLSFPPHPNVGLPRQRQRQSTMYMPSNAGPTMALERNHQIHNVGNNRFPTPANVQSAQPSRYMAAEPSLEITLPPKAAALHPMRRTLPPIPAMSPFDDGVFSK